jgi:hypothetical protein
MNGHSFRNSNMRMGILFSCREMHTKVFFLTHIDTTVPNFNLATPSPSRGTWGSV